jgi:hypothetical protein
LPFFIERCRMVKLIGSDRQFVFTGVDFTAFTTFSRNVAFREYQLWNLNYDGGY